MTNDGEPLSATPAEHRPRERLSRLGAAALTDAEVLALVLGSGRHGRNVVALSNALLVQAGGFRGLAGMTAEQLLRLPGVGPAVAGRLVASNEMWRRAAEPASPTFLTDADSIGHAVFSELSSRSDHRYVVLLADRSQRLRQFILLRDGSEKAQRVEVNEVVQAVMVRGGDAFALAHNHPGGSTEPSVADVTLTRRVRVAARAVGLRFMGHVIVGGSGWRTVE